MMFRVTFRETREIGHPYVYYYVHREDGVMFLLFCYHHSVPPEVPDGWRSTLWILRHMWRMKRTYIRWHVAPAYIDDKPTTQLSFKSFQAALDWAAQVQINPLKSKEITQ